MKVSPLRISVTLGLSILIFSCVSSFSDLKISRSVQEDINTIVICEQGLQDIIKFSKTKTESWGLDKAGSDVLLSQREKAILLSTWAGFLDYLAQLDHIQQNYASIFIKNENDSDREALYCYYLAFLTQYRYALEFLALVEGNTNIHTYLNEASPSRGHAENLYTQFKYHFLNVLLATKFVALDAILSEVEPPENFEHMSLITEAEDYLYAMGTGEGTRMTVANRLKIMEDVAFSLWLPLQKEVSSFMGGKKVWRIDQMLLEPEEVKNIQSQLEPGDILFTRKEWALTNLGLPGFWTHSALYIGTAAQRRTYFTDDLVDHWIFDSGIHDGGFERFLEENHPQTYGNSTLSDNGDSIRIIEALKPGVIFNSLETTLSCDGVAVLRPRVSKLEKAHAISFAFNALGKPYDLNFDFLTDSALVCSELVLKAYEPMDAEAGLEFETLQIGQRVVTPCNLIVQQFSENYGTEKQQLDFILFYDGYERQGRAVRSSVDIFLESWKRPDWHILTQE